MSSKRNSARIGNAAQRTTGIRCCEEIGNRPNRTQNSADPAIGID